MLWDRVRSHTHTHTQTHAARTLSHIQIHAHTNAHTRAHARAHTYKRKQASAHTHTHTHGRTRSQTPPPLRPPPPPTTPHTYPPSQSGSSGHGFVSFAVPPLQGKPHSLTWHLRFLSRVSGGPQGASLHLLHAHHCPQVEGLLLAVGTSQPVCWTSWLSLNHTPRQTPRY